MIGTTIHGYTISKHLGTGGMAQVWYAENNLGKPAAIKIMLKQFIGIDQVVLRFENEAKTMVQLQQPNIRQVYDYGEFEQRPFIIMEYLEGQDLSSFIKKKEVPSDAELERWWQQCSSALNFTHSQGVIHRDIKPSNLFLDKNGDIKILDFGIAKVKQEITLTATGQGLGTLLYMSPQQILDPKRVTPQCDYHSLAVSFIHLITGESPYAKTESEFQLQSAIVNGEINLDGLPAKWKERLEGLVQGKNINESSEPRIIKIDDTTRIDLDNQLTMEDDKTKVDEESKPDISQIDKEKSPVDTLDYENRFFVISGILITIAAVIAFYLGRVGTTAEVQPNNTGSFVDSRDGQSYNWVEIDDQVWMSENLNVDKFRNGDLIPHAKTREQWTKAGENGQPAWCYVENDAVNGKKYGKLYNWYAVKDPRGLAPKGWHIPTDEEWIKVTNNLGGQEESTGRKMQSTFGWKDNDNGTNESGFSGLPAGNRYDTGDFRDLGVEGSWWSSTEYGKEVAFLLTIRGWFSAPDIYSLDKKSGFNVRCLRD